MSRRLCCMILTDSVFSTEEWYVSGLPDGILWYDHLKLWWKLSSVMKTQSFSGNFFLGHVHTSSCGKEMNSDRPAATFFLETALPLCHFIGRLTQLAPHWLHFPDQFLINQTNRTQRWKVVCSLLGRLDRPKQMNLWKSDLWLCFTSSVIFSLT